VSARRVVAWSLILAAVGLVVLVVGLLVDPRRTWFAYLTAWSFAVSVCIGALVLLMSGHAAKASWMVVTRRLSEAVVGALPLQAVLFVPICLALAQIYPWVLHPDERKRRYLSVGFFVARSVVYFVVFIGIGALLRRWSRANDERPSMRLVHRMRALGGGGLPLVALTLTWASFDWLMSLQPRWSSTIFGLYVFAGAFTGAVALVAIMMALVHLHRGVPITPDHAQAVGRLLFAMIIFWAYMAFSQLLIYWIADLPHEVTFYGVRTAGTWTPIAYLLACGHLVVPFFLLLNRHWKRRTDYLASVAAWVLMMHFVDVYWLVLPVVDRAGFRPHLVDLGALLFVGGVSCAWIVRQVVRAAPLPQDPELAEGLAYEAAI
jgi:hypothetical protein